MEKQVDRLYEEIDLLFHPRSMAAVGASDNPGNQGKGFLIGYRKMGFAGKLYAIHPKKTIKGFETYRKVTDVPGPVDHVKIVVPARAVPEVVADCAQKGVRCVTIFSSGFRESGTAEGAALEEEVVSIASKGGVRVIGPNCMGLYCPETGLSIRGDMIKTDPGDIALIAQSGGVAISFALKGAERGVGMSKAVSYGNESDLGPPELLYYLARDPATRVICLYIEGSRRPAELKKALEYAAARKPVALLKGGITGAGERAVASHTGAMSGVAQVWGALARQSGACMAPDIDELMDLALLFSKSRPPRGKRVCLMTVSGGFGVFATDQIIKAGFDMPRFGGDAGKALKQYIDAPGTSLANPLDMAARFFQPGNYNKIFRAVAADPGFDFYIVIAAMEYLTFLGSKEREWSDFMVKALIGGLGQLEKPVYVVLQHTASEQVRLEHERAFLAAGYPVFPTTQRCLDAVKRSMDAKAGSLSD